MEDYLNPKVIGSLIIKNDLGEILLEKKNAVNYENISIALAQALAGNPEGHIQEMHFGRGGSNVTGDGTITYLPANVGNFDADLYEPTYYKVVNQISNLNTDPSKNNIIVNHTTGNLFTDIVIKCTLEFNEPAGQEAFDTAVNVDSDFIFDEIGLKVFNPLPGAGRLITHVIFSPIQKSLNRQIEIEYTLRIQLC
jgi:hypothetical protein